MDLLHLAVLCVSISLILLVYRRKYSDVKLPPGKTGWPIIGETRELVMAGKRGRPQKFTYDRMSRYSRDVFQTSLFGHKIAVLCGASGNKFLLNCGRQHVTSWFPRSMDDLYTSVEETAALRNVFPEFLKPEPVRHHISIMDSIAKEHLIANWTPHKQVKVFPLVSNYSFSLACRLFLRIKDPEHVARLQKLFVVLVKGFVSLPVNFPGTTYNQALRAANMLREEFRTIMMQRKRELTLENKGEEAADLLTRLLLTSDESGKATSYVCIPNKIIGTLFASHDTTSSSITMIMYYLAENPDVYCKVWEEQMEIAKSKSPGEPLNWDDIQKMTYSWQVACETMRISPPAFGSFKVAVTDLSYAGFTIPKGWKLHWTTHATHKNPEYFPDPLKFDPLRFEGNGPEPYTYAPFGAGRHSCPGKEFARTEILVFMHNVVTKFKWEKVIPNEKVIYNFFPMPEHGLLLHLYPNNE